MHEQPQIPQYKLTLNLASVGCANRLQHFYVGRFDFRVGRLVFASLPAARLRVERAPSSKGSVGRGCARMVAVMCVVLVRPSLRCHEPCMGSLGAFVARRGMTFRW